MSQSLLLKMDFRKEMGPICAPYSLFITKKTGRKRSSMKLRHRQLANAARSEFAKLSVKTYT
jgi:hypothetical protein